MSKQLRILGGLHRGAELPFAALEHYVIGSDAQCAVVLGDAGVAARHCVIAGDDYGATLRAIDAPVSVAGRDVRPGEVVSLDDFQLVRCGEAVLGVGPERGDWSAAQRALHAGTPVRLDVMGRLRRFNPYALFATLVFGLTSMIGLAYATLSDGAVELTHSHVEAARLWLQSVAPKGSELVVGVEDAPGRQLLLSGYVLSGQQLRTLAAAARASEFEPRLAVHAIDELTDSMGRLAQQSGLPCDPQHKGAGHFACASPVASDASAARLRMLARDVPGVQSLDVRVVAPVLAAAPPPVEQPAAQPPTPMQLTRKFAVLMFRDQRYLIGPYGERYVEGEQFDGFKINRIEVDKVLFEREGRAFEFHVAALRTAR